MNWTLLNILMLFGAFQGLVITSILIFSKKKNKKARLYLILILFALSMNLIYYFCYVVGLIKIFPFLKLTYLPWAMLAAISFYLYISFISPYKKKLTLLNKLGFIPFLVFSIVLFTTKCYNYFSFGETQITASYVSLLFIFDEYFAILFSLIMGYLSYKDLSATEIRLQNDFSNYNKSKLVFHKRLILVVFLFCFIWATVLTYAQINDISSLSLYFSIWIFMAFVIHWIAWTGFINDKALLPSFNKNVINDEVQISLEEKDFKTLKFDTSNSYYKELILLFEKEKLFLEPALSLEILANRLGISKSYLSALINQITNENFYFLVNSYRTEYLISLFKNKKNKEFTILSLAFDAGFNSKSTFQSFFKKYKGVTPSQFIKNLALEETLQSA